MTFWNLVLLSVPNERSHQGVSRKINPFSQIQIFFEIWAIVFNCEISPADRPNHFKGLSNFKVDITLVLLLCLEKITIVTGFSLD